MVVVVRESRVNIAKRQIRIQLCDLVGVLAAVFVRHSDIYNSDTCTLQSGCSVAVFFVTDYSHTRFFAGNAYQDLGGYASTSCSSSSYSATPSA